MPLAAQRIVAGLLLIMASPFLFIVGLAIRLTMGKPILFRQTRAGMGAHPFELIKFRTMRIGAASDDDRLTVLGRWLRRSSIDELPALWNVARGDMALVGPRPLLVSYTARYSSHQARRLDVKPGLTGWCQVNGRNSLTWAEKFDLDTWYVEHRNWRLDLAILARTARVVMSGSGVSHAGQATMPEFDPAASDRELTR
jgi:lipopolysaccharide/colanic/teichoic acid biosynthesis glycosyltransferase